MYRFGLATNFTAIVVAAVLSTGILVSAAMFFEGHDRLRDNEANVTLAAEFARYYIRGIQESLAFLAKNPSIIRAASSGDYREVAPILHEFLSDHTGLNSSTFYDPDGINRGGERLRCRGGTESIDGRVSQA